MSESLIVAPSMKLELFAFGDGAKAAKTTALQKAALIGKVTDRDSKIIAVRAQQELKSIISAIEKARKEQKEPLLNAGRQLDTLCASYSKDLVDELDRVTEQVSIFDQAERDRVLEEQRLQAAELARIEREKQAELDRIAREQREREEAARRIQEAEAKKAREAVEAAARLAAEATNKKQREAAEKARIEAEKQAEVARIEREKQDAIIAEQARVAETQAAAIQEAAGDAAYCASRPIEITKVAGQRPTSDWEITKINDWVLANGRPDLVRKIDFDMRAVKDELKRGIKLPGVEAKEVFTSGVRVSAPKAIEV